MSSEPMAHKTIKKINSRLRFPGGYFATHLFSRILIDYAGTVWHTNLNKKLKNEIQITQSKCVRFCLNLDNMDQVSQNDFEKLD